VVGSIVDGILYGVTPPPACPKTGILPEAGGRLNGGIKPPFLKEYVPIPPTGVDGILYGVRPADAIRRRP
jgi:hypothetical protein